MAKIILFIGLSWYYLKKARLWLNVCEKSAKNAIKDPTYYALGAINVLDYIKLLKIKEALKVISECETSMKIGILADK